MATILYVDGPTRSYVRESPATHLLFTENLGEAIGFPSGGAATAYAAARPTTLNVQQLVVSDQAHFGKKTH